jgi:Tol biopolymer transport system component
VARALWVLCIAGGCGRIGFDAVPAPDAALGSFGPPMRIMELAAPGIDDDPSLTADQLEIYFESERAGGAGTSDVWRSTRPDLASPWGPPAPVSELNTAMTDSAPEISADGLTIIFSSDRPGTLGDEDFYIATRAARGATFNPPVHVPELSSPRDDAGASLSADGREIVFASTRAGDYDFYVATRPDPVAPWSAPVPVAELSTGTAEGSPHRPTDDLLVFHRVRGGEADIYITARDASSAPWDPPVVLEGLVSPAFDVDPWLSSDRRTIYFSSNRAGNYDLYVATR